MSKWRKGREEGERRERGGREEGEGRERGGREGERGGREGERARGRQGERESERGREGERRVGNRGERGGRGKKRERREEGLRWRREKEEGGEMSYYIVCLSVCVRVSCMCVRRCLFVSVCEKPLRMVNTHHIPSMNVVTPSFIPAILWSTAWHIPRLHLTSSEVL